MKDMRFFLIAMSVVITSCRTQTVEQNAPAVTSRSRRFEAGDELYRAKWAIIVGIDKYPTGHGLSQLEFAVNDAQAIRTILQDEFGFADERVLYLCDQEATQTGIRSAFEEWLVGQDIHQDDAVLFFFSGHGDTFDDNRLGKQGYLAAFDSDVDDIAGTFISVEWIKNQLQKPEVRCLHKAVILDSCYSGSLFTAPPVSGEMSNRFDVNTRSGDDEITLDPPEQRDDRGIGYYLSRPAFLGLSAARTTPAADGEGENSHSVFTASLLRELIERTDSPRDDHAFTLRELAVRVERRVRSALGGHQIPNFGYLAPGDGDFLFQPTVRRATPRELENRRFIQKLRTRGESLVRQKDYSGGLLWYLRALELEDDPVHRRIDRIRIQMLMKRCPLPIAFWETREPVLEIQFCPSDNRFLTASQSRIEVWKPAKPTSVATLRFGRDVRSEFDRQFVDVQWSPDGNAIVTNSVDWNPHQYKNRMRIVRWDSQGNTKRQVFEHFGQIDYDFGDFSPDCKFAIIGGSEGSVVNQQGKALVIDMGTGDPLYQVITVGKKVASLCVDPQSRFVAISSQSRHPRIRQKVFDEVSIYDVLTGRTDAPPFVHPPSYYVTDMRFSSPTQLMTVARHFRGDKGIVHIWEVTSGELVGRPLKHQDWIRRASFCPDGRIYTASGYAVRIWDVDSGQLSVNPLTHEAPVTEASVTADSMRLVTACRPNGSQICLWDTHTGEQVGSCLWQQAPIDRMEVDNTGTVAVIASKGNVLSAWQWPLNSSLISHQGEIWKALLAKNGTQLLTAGLDGKAQIWDCETGQPLLENAIEPGGAIRDADLSYDGTLLVMVTRGKKKGAVVWNLAESRQVRDLSADGHAANYASFHPKDSSKVLTIDVPSAVNLYDSTGKDLLPDVFTAHDYRVLAGFTPDASSVYTVERGKDGSMEVRLWSATTGELRHGKRPRHETTIAHITFSPDGKRILTTSHDCTARVWDLESCAGVFPRLRHRNPVGEAEFSPDGSRIVTCSDVYARIWDATTGEPTGQVFDHPSEVRKAIFSPDGLLLLTSTSSTVWLRNINSGELVTTIQYPANITGVFFDRESTRLFVVSGSRVYVEDLTPSMDTIGALHNDIELISQRRLEETATGLTWLPPKEITKRWHGYRDRQMHGEWPNEQVDWHRTQFTVAKERHQYQASIWHLDRMASVRASKPELVIAKGDTLGALERWEEALENYSQVREDYAKDIDFAFRYAVCCLKAGELDRYRRLCSDLLATHVLTNDEESLTRIVEICVLGPKGLDDYSQLIEPVEVLLHDVTKKWETSLHAAIALLTFRSGDSEGAAAYYAKHVLSTSYDRAPRAKLFVSMMTREAGWEEISNKAFAEAKVLAEHEIDQMKQARERPGELAWPKWEAIQCLWNEANMLFLDE